MLKNVFKKSVYIYKQLQISSHNIANLKHCAKKIAFCCCCGLIKFII